MSDIDSSNDSSHSSDFQAEDVPPQEVPSEKRQMQMYLHQEIIAQGYEPENFADFMNSQKEDGCNLDNWDFEGLKTAVRLFIEQNAYETATEQPEETLHYEPTSVEVTTPGEVASDVLSKNEFEESSNGTNKVEVKSETLCESLPQQPQKEAPKAPLKIVHTDKFLETKQKILGAKKESKPSDLFDLFSEVDLVRSKKNSSSTKTAPTFDLLSAPVPLQPETLLSEPKQTLKPFAAPVQTQVVNKSAPSKPATLSLQKTDSQPSPQEKAPTNSFKATKTTLSASSSISRREMKVVVSK